MTPFDKQCEILCDLWLNFRNDSDLKELFDYFDLGFPLAFSHSEKLCELTEHGHAVVLASWAGILESFGITEDTGFESLLDIVDAGSGLDMSWTIDDE